jgi:hypothetical protein
MDSIWKLNFLGSGQAFEPGELVPSEQTEPAATRSGEWFKVIVGVVGVFLVLLSAGAALLTAQWLINPDGFNKMRDRMFPKEQRQSLQSSPVETLTDSES